MHNDESYEYEIVIDKSISNFTPVALYVVSKKIFNYIAIKSNESARYVPMSIICFLDSYRYAINLYTNQYLKCIHTTDYCLI